MVSVGVDAGVLLDRVEEVGQVGSRPDLERNWKTSFSTILDSKMDSQIQSPLANAVTTKKCSKSIHSHLASKWIPFSNPSDTEVIFILSKKA